MSDSAEVLELRVALAAERNRANTLATEVSRLRAAVGKLVSVCESLLRLSSSGLSTFRSDLSG